MRAARLLWVLGTLSSLGCGARHAPSASPGPEVVDRQRGYLSLADGSVHMSAEGAPAGLHVVGVVEGGRFVPEGDVQGEGEAGEVCDDAGWYELLEGVYYARSSGREPTPPYVEGAFDAEGRFCPHSRVVVY